MLGPRCCARTFSSCGKRGLLFIAVRGPLTIAASPVAEHGLQTRKLSNCGSWAGPVAPWHVGSSQTRARTRVPCTGRQILNHCATREALSIVFLAMHSIDHTDYLPQQPVVVGRKWALESDGPSVTSSKCHLT